MRHLVLPIAPTSRWPGLAAAAGGLLALILTAPFALGYHAAYPGYDARPVWDDALRPHLAAILAFDRPQAVYAIYGRVYGLVYPLVALGLATLHRAVAPGVAPRALRRSYGTLLGAVLLTWAGVVGDYWLDGTGFLLETIGLLALVIGAVAYGIALSRLTTAPRWIANLLLGAGLAAVPAMLLVRHLPSGPTLPFALAWIPIGVALWRGTLVRA